MTSSKDFDLLIEGVVTWEFDVIVEYNYISEIDAVYAFAGGGAPQAPEAATVEIINVLWKAVGTIGFLPMPAAFSFLFGYDQNNNDLIDELVAHHQDGL